jgi:hypothetical protein
MAFATLAQAKAFCNVGGTTYDSLLTAYLNEATSLIQFECRQSFASSVPGAITAACLVWAAMRFQTRRHEFGLANGPAYGPIEYRDLIRPYISTSDLAAQILAEA